MKKGKLIAAFALTTALTGGALTAGPLEDMKAKNKNLISSITKKKHKAKKHKKTRPATMRDLQKAFNLSNIRKINYTCPNGKKAKQGFKAKSTIKENGRTRTSTMWGGKCGNRWHVRNT